MKFTVKNKIIFSFSIIIFLLFLGGLYNIIQTRIFQNEYDRLYKKNVLSAIYLSNAQNALWQLRYGFPQFMVMDAAGRKKIVDDEPALYQEIDKNLYLYQQGLTDPKEIELLKDLKSIYGKYIQARPRWFDLYGLGKIEEAAKWRAATTTPFGAGTVKAFQNQIEYQKKSGEQMLQETLENSKTSEKLIMGLAAAAIVISIVIALILTRDIVRPFYQGIGIANSMASGDLTMDIEVKDVSGTGILAHSMKEMVGKLHGVISNVKKGVELIAVSSEELARTTAGFSANAQNQAANAEEITASVEEIDAGMDNIAVNTKDQYDRLTRLVDLMKNLSEIISEVDATTGRTLRATDSITGMAKAGENSLNTMSASMKKI